MTKQRVKEDSAGSPLMVCINDCALDQGQSSVELAPLCFELGCAFAVMRWKSSVDNSDEMAAILPQQTFQIYSNRLQQVI